MDDPACPRIRSLFDASLDGELDLVSQLAFDAHLTGCPSCAAAFSARRAAVLGIKEGLERFSPSDGLAERMLASVLPAPSQPARPAVLPLRSGAWFRRGAWSGSLLALAASLVLFFSGPGQDEALTRDLVGAHMRSLLPDHLIDVPSSDRHTVKPWFNGRVAWSPPVPDLAKENFDLVGGRLDYVDGHPASVLVYRRYQHVINLFVWSEPGSRAHGPRIMNGNGYHILAWRQDGLGLSAVSDLNLAELETFRSIWSAAAAESPPADRR